MYSICNLTPNLIEKDNEGWVLSKNKNIDSIFTVSITTTGRSDWTIPFVEKTSVSNKDLIDYTGWKN